MPIYKNNGVTYNIPDDKAAGFEAKFPGAMVALENEGVKYELPVSKKKGFMEKFPGATYSVAAPPAPKAEDISPTGDKSGYTFTTEELGAEEDANVQPLTTFGEGVKQGAESMYEGGRYAAGEIGRIYGDSQRVYADALKYLDKQGDNFDASSFDKAKAIEDERNERFQRAMDDYRKEMSKRRKERENLGFFATIAHKWNDPERPDSRDYIASHYDDMRAGKAIVAVDEALKEANGDIEKAREILENKAKAESWGDRVTREAGEALSQMKPVEGAAWWGQMVPQVAGQVAAIGSSFIPYVGAPLSKALAFGSTAAMTASSAGSAMQEARAAGATDGEIMSAGALQAGIEYFSEKIPLERLLGKTGSAAFRKGFKGETGNIVGEEVERLLEEGNKRLGGKLLSGQTAKEFVKNVGIEAASEFIAEGAGTFVPMIYEDKENYPTLGEALENAIEGAKAGAVMGGFLGGGTQVLTNRANNARRKKQGNVMLAETKDGVVEVLQTNDGNAEVLNADGEVSWIPASELVKRYTYTYNEWENNEVDTRINHAYQEGYEAADGQKGAVKQAYDMERERVLNTFGEEVVQRLDDDPVGALMDMNEVDRQEAIDYVNAKTAYDGMIDRISDDIDERIKASDKEIDSHKNKQDGMIHPAVMRGVNGAAPKRVYIVNGNVATFEDGTIDKANSSSMIIVRDAETGEVSAASADDLESLEAVIDTEAEKRTVAEQIANEYAGQQAVIIETESGTEGENGVQPVVAPASGGNVPPVETAAPVIDKKARRAELEKMIPVKGKKKQFTEVEPAVTAEYISLLTDDVAKQVATADRYIAMIREAQQKADPIEALEMDEQIAYWESVKALLQGGQPTAETAPVVEETQAPVVESAPVEEVETPQATNEMQEAETKATEQETEEGDVVVYHGTNKNQDIFVSNAQRAVEGIKQEKATPEQWIAMLKKNGGLKAGEEAWLGLEEWLTEKGKGNGENGKTDPSAAGGSSPKTGAQSTVTKQEILDFIGENKIQIEEVEYRDDASDNYTGTTGFLRAVEEQLEEDARYHAESEVYPDEFDTEEDYLYAIRSAIREYKEDPTGVHYDIAAEKVARRGDGPNLINSTRLEYTTDGLENKREIALTVPTIEPYNESDEVHFGDAGGGRAVAWVRFGETTDSDGNRVLVIDEIQSKRHQDGREKGYKSQADKTPATMEELTFGEYYGLTTVSLRGERFFFKSSTSKDEILDIINERIAAGQLGSANGLVPDAPFEKNWHELAMKRMLRLAAEEGFDKVAWTTGEQQAQRYNIGTVVNRIESNDTVDYDSTLGVDLVKQVVLFTRDGNAITLRLTPEGIVRASSRYNGHHISDIVGKELGNRIMTETDLVLKEQDLRIGGEGMKGFYDRMLPSFVSKYTKKWGAKVGSVEMPNLRENNTMHSVDVTPEMKESVMEGQTMLRQGAGPLTDREVVMESDPYSKVLGKPRYYGKRQREFVARQRRRMAEKARQVAEKLNLNNVEVLESTEGLTGKKATSKGWFDPKTGKITVVVPNHGSTGDIVETVLHEAVAHYGLRKLFGENFKNFLDNVYRNVTPEIRAEITELAKKHGWDFHTATEEYLASLAENTNFEKVNPSLWSNIKSFFMKMLAKVGITLDEPLGDNELRYILWRSHQNLVNPGWFNVFGQAEDIAKQYELGVGNYANGEVKTESGEVAAEDGIRFREGQEEETARERYERRVKTGMYQAQEALQDSMLGLKEAMMSILGPDFDGYIEDVPEFENAYIAENALSSINKAEVDAMANSKFKPLYDTVAKLALNEDQKQELIDYMFAKHGLERNEVMALRDAVAHVENLKKDIKNLLNKKTLTDEQRANLERAIAVIDAQLNGVVNSLPPAEAQKWYDGKKYSLDKQLQEGSITQQVYNRKLKELGIIYNEGFVGLNRRTDYAGLTALTKEADVVKAEAEARKMVEEYEAAHDTADLWEKVKTVNDAILRKQFVCGLMSKETYDKISSMYQYYIPLRGFAEETSADAYAYLNDSKSGFSAPIKTARGRKSKADDPFANLEAMAESGIMQGNRNRLVKQRFLNFVMRHRSDLASVSELWLKYNEVKNEWEVALPDNIEDTDSPEDVERKVAEFEKRMEELAEANPELYKRGKDAENIPYRVVQDAQKQQHQVIVKRAGKPYVITINGNPRAAQAINGQTNPDNDLTGAIGAVFKEMERLNRFLSDAYTTKNPDFMISNFWRDTLYSNIMTWIKESPVYAWKFNRNFLKVNPKKMKSLYKKYREGTLDMNNEIERMFKDFIMNGGETGYSNLRDMEQRKKDVEKAIAKAAKGGEATDVLVVAFEEMSKAVENCSRFAAFMTSRQLGRNMARSVYDAKEVSVNFNKKGAGAKFMGKEGQTLIGNSAAFISGAGRAFYVFWNAAIQGTTNFGRQFKRHPVKTVGTAFAMFVLGAIMAALGDDDEDDKNAYYNLPEYVRRSNILFRVGDSWVSIPLPVEFRALYGAGELMASVLGGKQHYTTGELAEQVMGIVSQVLPLDIVGDGGLKALIPSAARPITDVYVSNESWTGLPIYKDNDFNKNDPEWTKAYSGANRYLVGLAEKLNEWTGGDKYTKGAININPARVEYLLEQYFGGYASTVDKLVKTTEMMFGEREYSPNFIPLWNRMVKAGDERTEFRAVTNEYYRLKDEYKATKGRLNGYENEADLGVLEYAEKLDFLNNSPEYVRYEIFETYRRDIEDKEEEIKELKDEKADEKEIKEVEIELTLLRKEMIEEMKRTYK